MLHSRHSINYHIAKKSNEMTKSSGMNICTSTLIYEFNKSMSGRFGEKENNNWFLHEEICTEN